ncbi:MAG: pilus assembly protein, partial [Propioniciclava sp.]|nr:pilus assembly protein [Propioniciclava sp.]
MTSRRRRDERGSATIDMAIWLPVLFGVVFLTMQAGLYHYGRSAALAIATAGARAGAVEHGTNTTC